MSNEKIWYEDLNVLVDKSKLSKYIPLNSYTKNEKLNAIMRFSLYLSVLLIILTAQVNYIFILIVVGILTYTVDFSYEEKENKKMEKFEDYKKMKKDKHIKKRNIKPKNYVRKCVLPTEHNPFMNFMVSDKRDRKRACKTYNNEEIEGLMDDKFSVGLFKDIDSVYSNENSQREFYTMPNTEAANRQGEFADWCYKVPKTCKEGNGNQCVGNNIEKLNGESYMFI